MSITSISSGAGLIVGGLNPAGVPSGLEVVLSSDKACPHSPQKNESSSSK